MMVKTKTHDGEYIDYAYDPQHYESVVAFYDELVARGRIATWWLA